jgi:hypothetical protein
LVLAVLDNDIILKAAIYSLLGEVAAVVGSGVSSCGVLGASRFVVATALERRGLGAAVETVLTLIASAEQLEPTPEEAQFAAELEFVAQQAGLQLDAGESVLAAIAEARDIQTFVTGDKRAIAALEILLIARQRGVWWHHRVLCLEQVMMRLISRLEAVDLRDRICAWPEADVTLSICFSCAAGGNSPSDWTAGLGSYVEDLRRSAPKLLSLD